MSVSFGFYNSSDHDRKYSANEMSSLFDGLITDGIYKSIGGHFNVTQHAGGADMSVDVASGRAWFNHTWIFNSATLQVPIDESDMVLSRIDAVVIEINSSVDVRANSIKVVKGTPSSYPERPTLTNTADIHQYPLAYVTVPAAATSIVNSNIESMIGEESTPYVLAIVEMAATVANAIYPVGSIYMSTVNVNPENYFAGTQWEAWGQGKVLTGVDGNDADFSTAEKTGGTKSHSYTPSGSVSKPTFTGTAQSYTPSGSVSQPTFTGTAVSYTPAGSVSKPTFSGTNSSLSHNGGSVGNHTLTYNEMPSHEHDTAGLDSSGNSFYVGDGNYGVNVGESGGSYIAPCGPASSSFSTRSLYSFNTGKAGNNVAHNHPFTQPSAHSYTPAGSVSQPSFTGTKANITAAGTVSKPTFTGTATSITPAGSVSQPTFTGTAATQSHMQPYITCYMWKRVA